MHLFYDKSLLAKPSLIIGFDTPANKVKKFCLHFSGFGHKSDVVSICHLVGVLVFNGQYNGFKYAVRDLNGLKNLISLLIKTCKEQNSKIDILESTLAERMERILNGSISKQLEHLQQSGNRSEKVKQDILNTTSQMNQTLTTALDNYTRYLEDAKLSSLQNETIKLFQSKLEDISTPLEEINANMSSVQDSLTELLNVTTLKESKDCPSAMGKDINLLSNQFTLHLCISKSHQTYI